MCYSDSVCISLRYDNTLAYRAPGDCFLLLTSPAFEPLSGLESRSCLSELELAAAIGPNESDGRWVPFLGGRPTRLPVAVRFGPSPDLESLFDLEGQFIDFATNAVTILVS